MADVALAGRLFAPHYAAPLPRTCGLTAAPIRGADDPLSSATSELLPGEGFAVLDLSDGWAWGYSLHDHYVGYVRAEALGDPEPAPEHVVDAPSAPLFAAPDIKSPVRALLPMGSRLYGAVEGGFLAIDSGFVHARHVRPAADRAGDPVAVAEALLGTPYVWGGRGGHGIDCSGLVQLALSLCGIAAPRDSDQQRETLGTCLPDDAPACRGDLVFFPGHVGLMADGERLIHANAHWMAVTMEPLSEVCARLATDHVRPILARRRLA